MKFLTSLPVGLKCADRPSGVLELVQFVKSVVLITSENERLGSKTWETAFHPIFNLEH